MAIHPVLKALAAAIALALAAPVGAQDMLIIAHRGASGERPEHTLAAYERAIDQGSDFIEPDLVPTRDGVLVARHENEISGTTDVADHPEFAARLTTRVIDGAEVTGWFTEDFSYAELATLRARERLPHIRPANTAFDGLYQVPTLAEIIALVRAKEAETGRRIGIYPEIKHPTYFTLIGHDLAAMLVTQLHDAGYRTADEPVFIQSFEVTPLRRLDGMTDLRLVQLIEAPDASPADLPGLTYGDMLTPTGLAQIAAYADGLGPPLALVVDGDGQATGLVDRAHSAGLAVHGWTMRKENTFLPPRHRSSETMPDRPGCLPAWWDELAATGMDGIFTDDPGPARVLRDSQGDAVVVCSRYDDQAQ